MADQFKLELPFYTIVVLPEPPFSTSITIQIHVHCCLHRARRLLLLLVSCCLVGRHYCLVLRDVSFMLVLLIFLSIRIVLSIQPWGCGVVQLPCRHYLKILLLQLRFTTIVTITTLLCNWRQKNNKFS